MFHWKTMGTFDSNFNSCSNRDSLRNSFYNVSSVSDCCYVKRPDDKDRRHFSNVTRLYKIHEHDEITIKMYS